MNRRGGASEVVDLVDFDIERMRNVVAQCLRARIREQMLYILSPSCIVIVDAQDFVAVSKQPFA
jgi:hypothetical protein